MYILPFLFSTALKSPECNVGAHFICINIILSGKQTSKQTKLSVVCTVVSICAAHEHTSDRRSEREDRSCALIL